MKSQDNKLKLHANQRLWETIYDTKGNPKWAITSDLVRSKYYLYNIHGPKPVKVKMAASPGEFSKEIGRI